MALVAEPMEDSTDSTNSAAVSSGGAYAMVNSPGSMFPAPSRTLSSMSGLETVDPSQLIEHGWALSPSGKPLFWIPYVHRKNLWRSNNTLVIGENATKLDFAKFVHGADWTSCIRPILTQS